MHPIQPTPPCTHIPSVSPQEVKDIAQIIDKYPQFVAAKKIRDEKEAHFRRLCEEADWQMDVCDPGLVLDRSGVYGEVEAYLDKWIEGRVRELGLGLKLKLSGDREAEMFTEAFGKPRKIPTMGKGLGTRTITPLNKNTASAMQTPISMTRNSMANALPLHQLRENTTVMAKVASLVTRTTTPVNKNLASFASAMNTPSSLRTPSRLNITTTMDLESETQTQTIKPDLMQVQECFRKHPFDAANP